MVDCNKRQNEIYKGTPHSRCVHQKADTYLEVVTNEICIDCPLREFKEKISCCLPENNRLKKPAPKLESHNKLTVIERPYPECPFRFQGEDTMRCSITSLPVDQNICGRCDEEVREHSATFKEKVTNYFGAIRRWVALGRPTRTPEEVEQLFNDHCKNCDRYDKEKHACKTCGCSVSTDSSPLGNKLKMATESCPLGRF